LSRLQSGLLFSIALCPLAWAEPKLGVDVHKSSDRVELRLTQERPFENVSQKWRENPHRLEITIPKVEWQGKAVSNIDRGVLQKVEVKPGAGLVTVSVYSLQNPKMSWVGSADKKSWTLRIFADEMASNNEPPKLPGAVVAAKPVATPVRPPARPVGATPSRPVGTTPSRPVSSVPVRPPVNDIPPPAPNPARNNTDQRIISVAFINKDLPAAIREMAQAAGLEADVGPGVKGSVTATFKDAPLSQVISNVLGKQQDLYEFKIEGNRLRVFGDSTGAGATLMPTVTPPPTSDSLPKSGKLVSDYFPLKPDKPAKDLVAAIRRAVSDVEVIQDDRLNVLFVRGEAEDLEKVRNLLQNVLAK